MCPPNINEIVNVTEAIERTVTLSNNTPEVRHFSAELDNAFTADISYADSNQAGGPEFVWNDISLTGTHLDDVSDADEATHGVDLTFAFPYFGNSYQTVFVSSNGFVTLGEEDNQYYNYALPSSSMPRNEIAAFHTDLDLAASGDVYYQDYGDRVVIQFSNAARYDGAGVVTFQIVLSQDGTVTFYYKEMTGAIEDATVGLQDWTRTKGITIAYQQPYLADNLAVRIVVISEQFTNSVENLSWSDSDQPGGPEFVWDDITTTGTHMDRVSDFDDGSEPLDLSFSFPYFGDLYSQVFVSANGFVTLGYPSAEYRPYALPDPAAPVNDIAAFQNDLNLRETSGGSGDVYYQDYGDRVVIQYNNVARYAGDGFATFQIVLNGDGTILFYYKEMIGNVEGASVGIQNSDGYKGLTVANQQAYLKDNLAVRINVSSPWVEASPFEGTLGPGESANFTLTLSAQDVATGTFHGRLNIATDDPDDSTLLVPITMKVNEGPQVTLELPNHGSNFVAGDSVTFQATAIDPDGIRLAEFFEGDTKIGESVGPGFVYTWPDASEGAHVLMARAIDMLGAKGSSLPLTIDVQADSNHNGLGDDWEMATFGNLNHAGDEDFDHDGWTNLEEFQGGTNAAQFNDADGDGIGDGDEIKVYHTNPNSTDTDGDGMPDSYEIRYGLNPTADDGKVDLDGDKLTNLEEAVLGTDPNDPDSDQDGTQDGDDSWPTSKVFSGPRTPERRYMAIDLYPTSLVMNNQDQLAYHYFTSPVEQNGSVSSNPVRNSGGTPISFSSGLPTTGPSDIRLRYGLVTPYGLNDQGQVVGACIGFYEWNPDPGHVYPPENGFGPYFFPGDPGHFWNHPDYDHTILWQGGNIQPIDVPNSSIVGLNNAGAVLLSAQIGNETHVVIWQAGVAGDLGTGICRGFNNSGIVVGENANHAGWWRGAGFEPLPDFSGGYSSAASINDRNEIVGYSYVPPLLNRHACAWNEQEKLDLGEFLKTTTSAAESINARGQVVGTGDGAGVLWQNGHATHLNDLIADPNWQIAKSYRINDRGLILAEAFRHIDLPAPGLAYRDHTLLVPVDLMVDGNRDGQMSSDDGLIHDRDITTADRPYRFWLNDDDDTEID